MIWAAERRPRGILLPQGAGPAGCTPHFLFPLVEKKTGRARSKRKDRLDALRRVRASARRGSADRCKRRFWPAFGHAFPFCKFVTAVPWRMVRRSSGCKIAFDQLLFPRVPLRYALPWRSWKLQLGPMLKLSLTTGQRQRKSAQRVSRTSPGWRGSQGPDVSLSDRRKGSPTFPRRNVLSFPPGAVSPTAPVRRSTSVPSKSPHHEQDKKECILWQST